MSKAKKEIEELQALLTAEEANWQAEANFLTDLPEEEQNNYLGYVPEGDELSLEDRESLSISNLNSFLSSSEDDGFGAPSAFDLRNDGGKNFITPVKNQGSCGSCVAFGVVATVEGTKRKMSNKPNAKTDYSEAHLFYCHARSEGRHCKNGWWAAPALNAFKNKGVVDEACYPYTAKDQNCTGLCNDASSRITKITGWREIKNIEGMMTWLSTKGPLVACYRVYSDFFAYKTGVYKRTAGSKARGGHCVSIVGYNKTKKYWICKNSWGTGWGDKGYFKIAFGQVGIDATMWAVEGVEDNQWYKNTKIQGLWASSHTRNAYAYVQSLGWKKIANNNDNIFFNILTQVAAAKAANRPVNLHIVKGKINQIYVL